MTLILRRPDGASASLTRAFRQGVSTPESRPGGLEVSERSGGLLLAALGDRAEGRHFDSGYHRVVEMKIPFRVGAGFFGNDEAFSPVTAARAIDEPLDHSTQRGRGSAMISSRARRSDDGCRRGKGSRSWSSRAGDRFFACGYDTLGSSRGESRESASGYVVDCVLSSRLVSGRPLGQHLPPSA